MRITLTLGLDTLNLNEHESKVYVALLALGPLSLGEIIQHAGFSFDDTVQYLEQLKNKGYLVEISGVAIRYRVILPLDDLKASTEATITKMEDLAAQLDDHISKKLGIIVNKLREEAKKTKDGVTQSQESINQAEMKAESDVEARIAKFSLEVEQGTELTKQSIISDMDTKREEHQNLLAELENSFKEESLRIQGSQREINKKLIENYHTGLSNLTSQETERIEALKTESNKITEESNNQIVEGIHQIRKSVEQVGESLYSSIDQRNEKLTSSVESVSSDIASKVSEFSTTNQGKIIDSLKLYNDTIQGKVNASSKNAVDIFSSTGDHVKSKTIDSVQNLKQSINETLNGTQTQLSEILTKIQETISLKITETQDQIEKKMVELTENVQTQTDSNIQQVISNSEATFRYLVQESQTVFETTQSSLDNAFGDFVSSSTNNVDRIKTESIIQLNKIVDTMKAEIKVQIDAFSEALAPQEEKINTEISNFKAHLNTSQDQALASLNEMLTTFKETIQEKNQELNNLVASESENLVESVNQYLRNIENQLAGYDSKYKDSLINIAVKNSEKLIAQTRDIQEQMKATIGEFSKLAAGQLSAVVEMVSKSVETEVKTLETELTDYSYKFNEVTQANQDIFRNYLHSIEKIDSLIRNTKHPVVETAPIVSKEATLTYVNDMFSRITSGITILIPKIEDIPVDLILATKTSQRISLVTICNPEKDKDFLRKLLQKPNVRIRAVDPIKFEDVDKYIAADRDGEEVIIAVTEDSGEVLAIASLADSFIKLMGKIVLGDYFLARSQEIQRSEVGL